MFRVNDEKLINKLMTEVIPKIENQDTANIIKYNLALIYLIDIGKLKQIACLTGVVIGSTCFFAISSPIWTAVGATGAIASIINLRKTYKAYKEFDKLFKTLIMGLEICHGMTSEQIIYILKNISAEDLVDFLEKENLTGKEEV